MRSSETGNPGVRAVDADSPFEDHRAPFDAREDEPCEHGPLITIAIPTFNRAGMLRQTIKSVLDQKYANFELIVSDNASTDDTPDVVSGFADNRIRSLRQAVNIGAYGNANACIAAARGAYILILPDDDAIAADALHHYVRLLEQNPDLPVVMGAVEYVDDGKRPPVRLYEDPPVATGTYDGVFLLKQYLRRRLSFELCTVLFRTETLRGVGGFATTHHYAGDLATFARFFLHGRCGYVAAPCGLYRIGPHSETARLGTEYRLRDVSSVLQDLTVADSGLSGKSRREIRYLAAYHLALLALDHAAAVRRRGGSIGESLKCLQDFKWCFENNFVASLSALRSRATARMLFPARMVGFAQAFERPRWRSDGGLIRLDGPEPG